MIVFGIGNAFVWAPNSATATRNLPVQLAGAGSGVYNATRQVGAVLGSAAIAVLMDSRLAAEGLPSIQGEGASGNGALPPEVAQAFSDAMATSVLLPVASFAHRLRGRAVLPAPHARRLPDRAVAGRAAATCRHGASYEVVAVATTLV